MSLASNYLRVAPLYPPQGQIQLENRSIQQQQAHRDVPYRPPSLQITGCIQTMPRLAVRDEIRESEGFGEVCLGHSLPSNSASRPTFVRCYPAGSTGRCNTGVKSLRGGFKLQGLTWPFIELTRYFVQMGLRVHRQVGALRKVLSQ